MWCARRAWAQGTRGCPTSASARCCFRGLPHYRIFTANPGPALQHAAQPAQLRVRRLKDDSGSPASPLLGSRGTSSGSAAVSPCPGCAQVLVDECTQATEPEALMALIMGAKQVHISALRAWVHPEFPKVQHALPSERCCLLHRFLSSCVHWCKLKAAAPGCMLHVIPWAAQRKRNAASNTASCIHFRSCWWATTASWGRWSWTRRRRAPAWANPCSSAWCCWVRGRTGCR